MDSIISIFHIDWQIIIAQMINFLIVVFVLWFFAFKPLNQKMRERTDTIKQGLLEAKQISEQLADAEKSREETIKIARQEAQKIIDEAKNIADGEREKSVIMARAEIERVIKEEKSRLSAEKEKMILEIKTESAGLIATALEKLLSHAVDKKTDKQLIEKVLKEIK